MERDVFGRKDSVSGWGRFLTEDVRENGQNAVCSGQFQVVDARIVLLSIRVDIVGLILIIALVDCRRRGLPDDLN